MRDCSRNGYFWHRSLKHNANQPHCSQANDIGIFTPQTLVQAQYMRNEQHKIQYFSAKILIHLASKFYIIATLMIHKLRAGVYLLYNKYYCNPDQKAHFKCAVNICYC